MPRRDLLLFKRGIADAPFISLKSLIEQNKRVTISRFAAVKLSMARRQEIVPHAESRPISLGALALQQQLTLVTDGILKARNPTGEPFGFDRTAAVSAQSGEVIAQAAQDFGQEDEITALTLSFGADGACAGGRC